jgi:hypothetical protein
MLNWFEKVKTDKSPLLSIVSLIDIILTIISES